MRRLAASLAPMLALALALGLAGCGQKGPLTLPDDERAAERHDAPEAAPQDNENG